MLSMRIVGDPSRSLAVIRLRHSSSSRAPMMTATCVPTAGRSAADASRSLPLPAVTLVAVGPARSPLSTLDWKVRVEDRRRRFGVTSGGEAEDGAQIVGDAIEGAL